MDIPPLPTHDNRKARSHKGLLTAVILLAVLLGLSALINLGLMAAASFDTAAAFSQEGGADEMPQLQQRWSYGYGETKAVRIPLTGLIARRVDGGWFAPRIDKIRDITHQIRAATNDSDVRAIVLEVDSPGGTITASDELYKELMRFKESREDRVVVAFTRDLAASGGYYAALAADWIMAEPTSVVGSIGVIMQSLNWKKLADDIGISDVTIKSGENKDMLNPFREADEAQIQLLQEVIDLMHARFKGLVQANRKIDAATLDRMADGRIFTADQALDLNLIDQIGYWDDVVARTAELLGEDSVSFVQFTRPSDFFSLLTQVRAPTEAPALVNPTAWLDRQTPRIMYLWKP